MDRKTLKKGRLQLLNSIVLIYELTNRAATAGKKRNPTTCKKLIQDRVIQSVGEIDRSEDGDGQAEGQMGKKLDSSFTLCT